jgi:hypothetical protein
LSGSGSGSGFSKSLYANCLKDKVHNPYYVVEKKSVLSRSVFSGIKIMVGFLKGGEPFQSEEEKGEARAGGRGGGRREGGG